jgi:hypothetical protein
VVREQSDWWHGTALSAHICLSGRPPVSRIAHSDPYLSEPRSHARIAFMQLQPRCILRVECGGGGEESVLHVDDCPHNIPTDAALLLAVKINAGQLSTRECCAQVDLVVTEYRDVFQPTLDVEC